MLENTSPTTAPRRRVILSGAAWSTPVILTSIAAPMAAASNAPSPAAVAAFSSRFYGWPDTTASRRTGKFANGVSLTVSSADGQPVAAVPVTFTITEFDDNSLWFVENPETPVGRWGEVLAPQLPSITLTTDSSGVVSLDGYLRRGSDANGPDLDQMLLATVQAPAANGAPLASGQGVGYSADFSAQRTKHSAKHPSLAPHGGITATAYWALSSLKCNFGNDDCAVKGPADRAQHHLRDGRIWK